uniref:tRNA-dihydrouridine synthase n=1 Tax=candidate division CPR3 bacterium TaxID=2268181 RepID=A0A7C4R9Z2_UNCC3
MNGNIWKKFAKTKKPFFILAPMAGVTDSPFRQMILKLGRPDLVFTEFVSTEMIWRNTPTSKAGVNPDLGGRGKKEIPLVLKYSKKERPLIVQFFGCKVDQFETCARLAIKLGFDGIDINVGCPDKKVLKQGSGSELIKNPELVIEIIRKVKEMVEGKIPVSVKTRIGYSEKNLDHILVIAKEGVDAITIHGRTAKQGYSGLSDWDTIGEVAKKIKKVNPSIIVVGNGDIKDIRSGALLCAKYGVDGVMIGRRILSNPWVFGEKDPGIEERLKAALKHTLLYKKHYLSTSLKASIKEASIGAMKKYYKAYLSGFSEASNIRKPLMEVKSFEEAERLLLSFLNKVK